MNPTTTEHDYRFPRRPADAAPGYRKPDRFDPSSLMTQTASTTKQTISSAAAPRTTTASTTSAARKPGAAQRAALHQFGLDVPATQSDGQHELLRAAAFPPFQQCVASEFQNLDEMQRQDPLATQVWRFYAMTKQRLPARERMENLTWRMMHFKLPKPKDVESKK
jgi:GATA-binding protein